MKNFKIEKFTDLSSDTDYEKLFESYNYHQEKNLPSGVWQSNESDFFSWSEIEKKTLAALENKLDYKLFTLWSKAYLKLNGFFGLSEVFECALKIFNENKDIENFQDIINYFDKNLYAFLLQISVPIENEPLLQEILKNPYYKQYFKEERLKNELNWLVADFDYLLNELRKIEGYLMKLKEMFEKIRLLTLNSQEDEENNYNQGENFDFSKDQTKEEALELIEKGINALYEIDPNNLALPLLKKGLKWTNYTTFEILEEIGSGNQIEVFINLIKS